MKACSRRPLTAYTRYASGTTSPPWWPLAMPDFSEDLALFSHDLDLATQATELLALARGQPVGTTSGIEVSALRPQAQGVPRDARHCSDVAQGPRVVHASSDLHVISQEWPFTRNDALTT